MDLRTFHRRSLSFHWRTNLAVTLGVAVGTSALTGALLVGDSMRESLREVALGRLGRVDHALTSNRFFREALASDITASDDFVTQFSRHVPVSRAVPVILLRGGAVHTDSHGRANRINILGVDDRFWELQGTRDSFTLPSLTGRSAIINEPLARDLAAKPGDAILIRVGKPSPISTETLLGRRDDMATTLRLTVQAVIPAKDIGAFSLNPRQLSPRNAYIPLSTLQRALDRRNRANAILVASKTDNEPLFEDQADFLQQRVETQAMLQDLGLRLRIDQTHGYFALESFGVLIEPSVEAAALLVADELGVKASPILTYLANAITSAVEPASPDNQSSTSSAPATEIPYSTVTALDPASPVMATLTLVDGGAVPVLQAGEILLNTWAADDLQAQPGDRITLTYYVTGPFGRLETQRTSFLLRSVVALAGGATDPGFTPEYKGVTDTDNLADWDPPFPMDLDAIRDKDEAYWDEYRATPKAFITLEDGQRLWAQESERFGRLTSIRLGAAPGTTLTATAKAFERELLKRIDLKQLDLSFEPARARMAAASEGTTDFGMLFLGFSFFLIASAAMLVALLFRLSVERRSGEVGLLLSAGFSPRVVTGMLVTQGAVLGGIGGVMGLAGALGYAWFMLTGLRSWWSDAVNTPFLRLHALPSTFVIGFVASFLVAMISIAWSIRGLTLASARSLLMGVIVAGRQSLTARRGRFATMTAVAGLAVAIILVVLPATTDVIPQSAAFFGSGAAMLVGCLGIFTRRLQIERHEVIRKPGGVAIVRLGVRNARRHRGRSILTAGLIASATFLIVALEAFRLEADAPAGEHIEGTGGFTLFAESVVPLVYNLNTRDGREALNLAPAASDALSDVTVIPFRLRPGDESSCLNLYRPNKPRILGATEAMIQRGGFVFASTLAESAAEKSNPWTLLHRTFSDGAIPVIGDESAVMWQLHLGLGKDLIITESQGREVRLRFVALLAGSVLQDELIVAESSFVQLFPSIGGYAFFLIDAPIANVTEIEHLLERELATFSLDVGLTTARLAEYLAVQNTYLSTFQTLGGFGLVLGTVGLAAVLLRNVWERRGELALMRALGFSRATLGGLVLAENVALLVTGLLAGLASAMLAIAPHIAVRPTSIPWWSLGLTLAAVFATGVGAGMIAIVPTLRAPLLPSLRAE